MSLHDYLALPYHFELVQSATHGGTPGWYVRVEELDGCQAQGPTIEAAMARVRDAMEAWIAAVLEDGGDVPLPREEHAVAGS